MSEQVVVFSALKDFVQVLKEGREGNTFINIDVEGVERTVDSIRKQAAAKAS